MPLYFWVLRFSHVTNSCDFFLTLFPRLPLQHWVGYKIGWVTKLVGLPLQNCGFPEEIYKLEDVCVTVGWIRQEHVNAFFNSTRHV